MDGDLLRPFYICIRLDSYGRVTDGYSTMHFTTAGDSSHSEWKYAPRRLDPSSQVCETSLQLGNDFSKQSFFFGALRGNALIYFTWRALEGWIYHLCLSSFVISSATFYCIIFFSMCSQITRLSCLSPSLYLSPLPRNNQPCSIFQDNMFVFQFISKLVFRSPRLFEQAVAGPAIQPGPTSVSLGMTSSKKASFAFGVKNNGNSLYGKDIQCQN